MDAFKAADQFFGIGGGYRISKDGRFAAVCLKEIVDGLLRKTSIKGDRCRIFQQFTFLLQMSRRKTLQYIHVRYCDIHLTIWLVNRHIGGADLSGKSKEMFCRQTRTFAGRANQRAKIIISRRGDEIDWKTQAACIFAGVMGCAADGNFDLSRIGVLGYQRPFAPSHDIHIDSAHADDVRFCVHIKSSCTGGRWGAFLVLSIAKRIAKK